MACRYREHMPVDPAYLHLVYPGETFNAFLYGRNSHDPTGKGRSVDGQLHEGRDLCERHSFPIVGVFDKDVGRSASRHGKKRRDDFEAMLEGIAARECRIVIAFEASRYYRDLEAYVRLRNACYEANVLLCYNGTVYDLSKREDRKATARDALDAEDEAEGIRDRQVRTQRQLAEQGKPGGRTPFGYKRSYDPETGELVEQVRHPVRAPYVAEMFTRLVAGQTLYGIAQWLNSEPAARHPGGRLWGVERVGTMLRNPAYNGKRVHQGKIVRDAKWPPISDDEDFPETYQRAQAILADPTRLTHRLSRLAHLLTYIPLCGEHEEDGILSAGRRVRPAEIPAPDPGVVYADDRCHAVRAMYQAGWRPVLPQMRRVVRKGHGEVDDDTLRALRDEVERHEPSLALLVGEPPPFIKTAKRNGTHYYLCSTVWDTGIRAPQFEAYVEEAIIGWLRSPAASAAFQVDQDIAEVKAARTRLFALENQLQEARTAATTFRADGTPELSVMSLAAMETMLTPQIDELREVADRGPASVPPLLRDLVGNPDAEQKWNALLPEQKRSAMRMIVTIRLFHAHVKGAQKILPGRITLSFVGEQGFRKDG
jgi:DNA invertase Pin-like site-specific DNA recombinase